MGNKLSHHEDNFLQEKYMAPPCSYDDTLPHLTFIREKGGMILIPLVKIIPPFPQGVIIYSHAQKQDLGVVHDHLVNISEALSVIVLGYDYPTYGMNTRVDVCIEEDVQRVMLCVYKYALSYSKSIILYGAGVGCQVTNWLGQKYHLPVICEPLSLDTDDRLSNIIQAVNDIFTSKMICFDEKS